MISMVKFILPLKKDLALGDKVKIKITACYGYDLEGEYIEE